MTRDIVWKRNWFWWQILLLEVTRSFGDQQKNLVVGFLLVYIDQCQNFLINFYDLVASTNSQWHSGRGKKGCFVSWCCISSPIFLNFPEIFHHLAHTGIRLLHNSLSLRVCISLNAFSLKCSAVMRLFDIFLRVSAFVHYASWIYEARNG